MRISLLPLALAAACANPAPENMLRGPEAMQRAALGSWVQVQLPVGLVSGELLAVSPDVFVLDAEHRVHRIPRRDVVRAKVQAYDPQHAQVGIWGGLGVLSTASHGIILVVSAPVWLLAAFVITAGSRQETIFEYPEVPLDSLARWARFPQGLPANVDPVSLHRLPPPPPPPPPPATEPSGMISP